MLLSVLISLSSTAAVPILGPLGRPTNAWLLGLLTRCHTDLAAALHNMNGLKPYTVSTLLNDFGQPLQAGKWLQPGEFCWLRITTLDPALSEIMFRQVMPNLPDRLSLYKMEFRIDGWSCDPAQHSWAGSSSYSDIAQAADRYTYSRQVRMEFVTPTAFHAAQNAHPSADLPLPIPAQVFRSYWQKWNAFAPQPMQVHLAWPNFVEACVMVNELTAVNSLRWSFAEGTRGIATGFTGTVGFNLLPKHHSGQWEDMWDDADRVMQTLAHYAFYCGTGHHTTVGMGQTRTLSPLTRSDGNSPTRNSPQHHSRSTRKS